LRRRALLLLLPILTLCPPGAGAADGYRLYEATAASVNREVLFLNDVIREQCLRRCVAMPGSPRENLSLEEARNKLIADTLALQEQRKLELGQVDNAVLAAQVKDAVGMMERCPSPCRVKISPGQVSEWVERKLLIRDFLRRRVAVFVEIKEEDVRREYRRRAAKSDNTGGLSEEAVRESLLREKEAEEVRNWYDRTASKSRIILSPLEER
jgi:hypothetical protein